MTFEISKDVTLTTSDSVLIRVLTVVNSVKAVIKAYNELPYNDVIKATGFDYNELSKLMDDCDYELAYEPYHRLVTDYYWQYMSASDDAYRRYAEADFLAFEHENVDYASGLWIGSESDYNMYSDWSKDIYGRRKRWKVASRLSDQESEL